MSLPKMLWFRRACHDKWTTVTTPQNRARPSTSLRSGMPVDACSAVRSSKVKFFRVLATKDFLVKPVAEAYSEKKRKIRGSYASFITGV